MPDSVRGAAFQTEQGHHLYVLWAHTATDESATAQVSVPASDSASVSTFDIDNGPSKATLTASNGELTVPLTGMPTALGFPSR